MSRDALVVGINSYINKRMTLKAPAKDAEAIAQLLEQYGDFKVKRLPEVTDKENNTIKVGEKTDVTKAQLQKAIVQLFKPEGKPPDTALLYFSGHGLREIIGIEEGYLATSDVNPDLGNWGVRLKWLRELLQESPVRQQILILDCCYSGQVLNFAEADPGNRGEGRDRCFIAASREYEKAYEEIGNQYSVLTAALIKGLEPKQEKWVTNYTLINILNDQKNRFPQKLTFTNFGGAINLTRTWDSSVTSSSSAVASGEAICPYKGLSNFDFTEEDAKYFCGRKALTDQLLEKVRTSNFLAILGASGSGKSSVLRAGLLYQLKLGQRLSGSNSWQIRIFRPGEHPLQSLALAFVEQGLSDIDRATQLSKAEELIAKGADGLRQLRDVADTSRVVVVIDQFEEVFTLCKDTEQRQQFFKCLLTALEKTGDKLCLVLAMRADFFGKCAEQEYAGLAKKIQGNLVTVTPMSREELRQAITEPASKVGLELEPELVDEMIADVENSPGSLPLLQYTLTELWKLRTEEKLTLTAYTRIGRVRGTLQKRATEVYESLSPEEQQAAKRIFLELTQLGEGTEDTRRQVLQRDLATEQYSEALINRVIQKLADEKLIVTSTLITKGLESRLEPVAVVDVAHEALIRHWSLLRQSVEDSRDMLRQKRKIEAAAVEWRDKGKSRDYLLQSKQLNEAIAFQKEQTANIGLSDLACDFIQESIRYKRNNRLKVISFSFIPLTALVVYLGVVVEKHIRIKRHWDTVEAARGQIKSSERIQALQELVKAGVPLSNIRLDHADLRNANLIGADFKSANLSDADLRNTNLSRANLNSADLSNANLSNANLSNANLSNAKLFQANLIRADLRVADLRRANLRNADLRDADLRDADLSNAKLFLAKLFQANLSSADLSNANLSNADLRDADLRDANLSSADLRNAKLFQANLSSADLRLANLIHADLWRANLSGANLSSAYLRNAKLFQANLSSADLGLANLSSAYLWRANLSGANLSSADLRVAYLIDANLSGANLSGANLSSADLRVAYLIDANLSGANLSGANLSGAKNLIPKQVKSAKYWQLAEYDKEFRAKLGLQNLQNKCNCLSP
ncbi:nSTAND1 domain-containing NTPase [Scytonema sp. PRP1]|uniref:nSTAND1 domain-containing NTPase n=1 Tax=Scytonema sp. PRP1 TaxID=3120513 RepID=UPI002FD3C219